MVESITERGVFMNRYTDVPAGVGIGTYSLSGAYGQKNLDEFRRMLLCAVEKGVRFFDTSETYGDETEQFLGDTFRGVRKEIFLCTKVGMKGNKKPDLSYESVRHSCEKSLKNLLTEYIDLYMIHFDDPQTPVEETVQALSDLQNEGKIRQYGVSHLPVRRVTQYCDIGSPGSIMAEFSAVSPGARYELFPLCRDRNIALIAFSVTGRGILTGKYDSIREFEPGDIRRLDPLFKREKLECALAISKGIEDIAIETGITRAQLSIAWVLSHPGVRVALTGPSTIAHMLENIRAQEISVASDVIKEIDGIIENQRAMLRTRQEETVTDILSDSLPDEPSEALSVLMYVAETVVELGLVSEELVMGRAMKLFSIQDRESEEFRQELLSFRAFLSEQPGLWRN